MLPLRECALTNHSFLITTLHPGPNSGPSKPRMVAWIDDGTYPYSPFHPPLPPIHYPTCPPHFHHQPCLPPGWMEPCWQRHQPLYTHGGILCAPEGNDIGTRSLTSHPRLTLSPFNLHLTFWTLTGTFWSLTGALWPLTGTFGPLTGTPGSGDSGAGAFNVWQDITVEVYVRCSKKWVVLEE
jgi:hypothetical protein